jgi:tRNA nucleotidyltransferase (CCA-adding enzyme)
MNLILKPKTDLERFGFLIFSLLVENFPQTFIVGGAVRDALLNKKITDIDIATIAEPGQVAELLLENQIQHDSTHKNFGVIQAKKGILAVEITTFRKEHYSNSRYPQIQFIKDVKIDSKRRDFSINSLYLSLKSNNILDFYKGIKDIQKKEIKFIGNPTKKIKQDPLRIVRALRFACVLNFKIEKKSLEAIKNNFNLIKSITKPRLSTELNKIQNKKIKNNLVNIISGKKMLDNIVF